jgi:mRNA interferase HicA
VEVISLIDNYRYRIFLSCINDFFLYQKHNTCVKIILNSKQMKKWLEAQGATFLPGKGSHLKVFLGRRQSTLPMHGTTELGKGLEAAIKRQLGLK